jgi:hypothetical protein
MAIVPPRLDDRAFADLRAELIRRIPVHAPEWTDHNASDPGIALIELFAALGDNLLYRFNRVPEAARLQFLKLLAIPPRPARPALAQVRIDLPGGSVDPVIAELAPGVPRLTLDAGEVRFQALDEVTALPVELKVWTKRPYVGDLLPGGDLNMTTLLQDHLDAAAPADPSRLDHYEPVPLPAPEGGVLPAAVSSGGTLDQALWLCLLAPEKAIKTLSTGDDAAALHELRRRIAGEVLNVGVRPDASLCGATDHARCPNPGEDPPRWPLQWEISTGRFSGAARRLDRVLFQRLDLAGDDTNGLTRAGTVRLRLPPRNGDGGVAFGDWTAESFDEPDPDLLGVGPLPPRIDDEGEAARVLAWVRVARKNPTHPPITMRWMDANVVWAEQAITAPPELLGYGDGRTGQAFTLSQHPVLTGSEQVQVRGVTGWENWQRVEDLAEAGPDDPFYRLDPATGAVTFGDGIHGRIPLPGEAVRCLTYRWGGGSRGNVGAGRIKRVRDGAPAALALKPMNPLPAEGGQDPETQEAAAARIPSVLRHRERAVAAQDFVDLALETPGPVVGRAHVLPRHKPHERVDGVPGTVTLIVLPAYDPLHPDEPVPDREMLRRVCAHLEPRRLVTTELYVTPPQYVPLSCSIAVEAVPGTGEETLRRHVELALRQHLAPLPPYGPAGAGWPFGRMVQDRDLQAAALRVQGVRLVNEILVVGTEIARDASRSAVTERVRMQSWQLPVVREVRVALGETAEPLPPLGTEPEPAPVEGLPVPVGREAC